MKHNFADVVLMFLLSLCTSGNHMSSANKKEKIENLTTKCIYEELWPSSSKSLKAPTGPD